MKPGERLQPIRNIPPGDAPHLMAEVPAVAERPGTPLLECVDIRKSFRLRSGGMFRAGGGPRVMAVDGVSLRIARGECLGLVGESGCGKTTLSKILMRAVPPDSGSHHLQRSRYPDGRAGARWRRADALPPPGAVHLPGPVRVAEPAHDGRRHHRRAADHPRRRRRANPRRAGFRAARAGRVARRAIGAAIRTASRAGSGSASASPARWRCGRSW